MRLPEAGADWLVEEGIAEHRAVRLDGDRIAEARVDWPGRLAAGWVVEAKLVSRVAGSARGTARTVSGEKILVDRLPKVASEGAPVRLIVTRAALDGPGRFKRAQGRPSGAPLTQPALADRLRAQGAAVRVVRRFPAGAWEELIDDALAGVCRAAAGASDRLRRHVRTARFHTRVGRGAPAIAIHPKIKSNSASEPPASAPTITGHIRHAAPSSFNRSSRTWRG